MQTETWLALMIGNTRLHWGFFQAEKLIGTWHTPHLVAELADKIAAAGFQDDTWQSVPGITPQTCLPPTPLLPSQLWIASAVPEQTALWIKATGAAQVVTRSRIPLSGLYATLGSDRAINLLGAGYTLGWPVLVIDSGTALTFTAGGKQIAPDRQDHQPTTQSIKLPNVELPTVYGGAILPGMRLQAQALGQHTAALSEAVTLAQAIFNPSIHQSTPHQPMPSCQEPTLPERWATDSAGAIASGLVYGAIAAITDYLTDWWHHFPTGNAVLTGGDGPILHTLLKQALVKKSIKKSIQSKTPEIASRVRVDSHLMFWGMRAYRQAVTQANT